LLLFELPYRDILGEISHGHNRLFWLLVNVVQLACPMLYVPVTANVPCCLAGLGLGVVTCLS